jgi:hypothetical protein
MLTSSFTDIDNHWQVYAACHGASDRTSFFDTRHPHPLCNRCPVAEVCLWAALAAEQHDPYRYGCWGGVTAARRARIGAALPDVDLTTWYRELAAAWRPPSSANRRPHTVRS